MSNDAHRAVIYVVTLLQMANNPFYSGPVRIIALQVASLHPLEVPYTSLERLAVDPDYLVRQEAEKQLVQRLIATS